LLGTVCFFILVAVYQFFSIATIVPLKPTTVLSVVFSLFYFFQYVKERSFPSVTVSCDPCRKLGGE